MARAQKLFPDTFDAIPYWDGPLDELGLDLQQCHDAGHLLVPTSDGRVRVLPGAHSWAGVLQLQGPPWRMLGWAMEHQPVKLVADAAYGWVAANRARLGPKTCTIPDSGLDCVKSSPR